jgi:hypothetical protein
MPIRHSLLAALLASLLACSIVTGQAAQAGPLGCSGACKDLLAQAEALQGQGKYREALDKYEAASKAEATSSLPLSLAAAMLSYVADRQAPEQRQATRARARVLATQALHLSADDPVAQEVLRTLDDGPTPLHRPTPAAAALMHEAESQFMQRHYPEALAKYEAAMQADPQFSEAWVGAGDAYYSQKDWPHAEAMFRRATEIEPRNGQAWRYLADALFQQHRAADAESALLSGIAADPSQGPTWTKLAALRSVQSLPLKSLGLRRGVRVTAAADGKSAIDLDSPSDHQTEPPDLALRLALGAAEVKLRAENKAAGTPRSPFQIELASWRTALQVVDEARAKTGQGLSEPALRQMQAFARDGQLEPALLILTFRQAYRPDLDAWIAAHPRGVKAFIDRYGLRP